MRMRALTLVLVTSIALATQVSAQTTPTKEYGVDLSISSIVPDAGDRVLQIGAPVDVRIGFLSAGRPSYETRFSLSYLSDGGNSLLQFSPSLNLIFSKGGARPYLGPYFTVGALADVVRYGGGDSDTRTQFGVTVGVGDRNERGQNGAFRPEFFVTKKFAKGKETAFGTDYTPGSLTFGVRFGLSFFQ